MPRILPLRMEKRDKTPKDLAGIHSAKQRMPVRKVMKPATSTGRICRSTDRLEDVRWRYLDVFVRWTGRCGVQKLGTNRDS